MGMYTLGQSSFEFGCAWGKMEMVFRFPLGFAFRIYVILEEILAAPLSSARGYGAKVHQKMLNKSASDILPENDKIVLFSRTIVR